MEEKNLNLPADLAFEDPGARLVRPPAKPPSQQQDIKPLHPSLSLVEKPDTSLAQGGVD
jgi:hypothetical protein